MMHACMHGCSMIGVDANALLHVEYNSTGMFRGMLEMDEASGKWRGRVAIWDEVTEVELGD